jgi:sigma-B regulation protein RsbU (phosphoserine phosphatase)
LPLGVVGGSKYVSCQLVLEPRDTILAFTDGVTEAMNVQDLQLQTSGLCAAMQGESYSPRALGDQVVEVVKQFSAGRSQHDDIAVVGFGRLT